jgi:hypothetical protein
MSALRLSWDAPYRLLSSLVAIAGICACFGLLHASSPAEFLGQIGTWLGMPDSRAVATAVHQWLVDRHTVISGTALVLFFAGLALNLGGETGTSASKWRGAPTAILSLSVIHEVDLGLLVGIWWLVGISGVVVLVWCFTWTKSDAEFRETVANWIGETSMNLIAALLYVLSLPAWLVTRKNPSSS